MLILELALIGSLLLLDKYAIGEFGLSQPLVVGPIIGMIFGSLEAGLLMGALVQLLFFSNLPIGRSIPPDSQAGAVLGISTYVMLKGRIPHENLFTFSFLIAILGSVLATYPDIFARKLSNRLYQRFIKRENEYFRLHLLGLGIVFARGLLFLLVMLIAINILSFAGRYFKIETTVLLAASISVGGANAIYLFYKKKYVPFLAAGVLIGCLYQYLVR